MKKSLLVFATLMLIAPLCFSQQGRAVIDGDTLYLVPVENLRRANLMFAELDFTLTENRSLMQRNAGLYELSQTYKQQAAEALAAYGKMQAAYNTQAAAVDVANLRVVYLERQVKRRNFMLITGGASLALCIIKIISR